MGCDSDRTVRIEPPNILFVEVDDLTAKYLGFNGSRFAITPNIDSLAKNGVYFKNAMVQGVMCTPSRNSLITGQYPHQLGLYENLDLKSLPHDCWTFPSSIQQEGYTNFWVGKSHLLPSGRGIKHKNFIDLKEKSIQQQMGFDSVYQSYGRSMMIQIVQERLKPGQPWETGKFSYADYLDEKGLLETFAKEGGRTNTSLDPNTDYMDGHFTTYAISELSEYKSEKPFFMWLNYSGPHRPFDVPRSYYDKFWISQMPAIIPADCENFTIPAKLKSSPNTVYDSIRIAVYRRQYMASISYVDEQVGRIVEYIKSSRYKDNTAIVFFSDHGIMTGDHGLLGKNTLFQEVLDAALIIWYPKEFEPRIEETTVELLDLGKTAMAMANVHDSILKVKQGNSLLPLLKKKGRFNGNGLAFSEMKDFKSVFDGQFKYIHNKETPILFNLKDNPEETENWIDRYPERAEELRQAVEEFLKK